MIFPLKLIKDEPLRDIFLGTMSAGREEKYQNNDIDFIMDQDCVNLEVDLKTDLPKLNYDGTKSDAANAANLYDSLGDLHIDFALDQRLWASLAHLYYSDYVYNRWIEGKEVPDIRDIIKSRYFTLAFGSDRSLVRNAISRLWFGAYLTVDRDEKDLQFYFEDITDIYFYTKILFSLQDIQQGLLERSYGRNKKILLSVLHFFSLNKNKINRNKVQNFTKKLCLALQHTKLSYLEPQDILAYYNKYLAEEFNT